MLIPAWQLCRQNGFGLSSSRLFQLSADEPDANSDCSPDLGQKIKRHREKKEQDDDCNEGMAPEQGKEAADQDILAQAYRHAGERLRRLIHHYTGSRLHAASCTGHRGGYHATAYIEARL